MNDGINLLRSKQTVAKKSGIAKALRVFAISSLFLVAFFAIGMFFLRTQSKLPRLQQQEDQLQSQLSLLQEKVTKYVLIQDRLRGITMTLRSRSTLDASLASIALLLPSGVTIETLKIDKKTVELNVSTASLDLIDQFFQKVTDVSKTPIFSRVVMESLSYDPKNARYSVLIKGDLK